jgi:nucleoside-diphosphate-sugar epimerase
MRVLIIGCGYVGTVLGAALAREGHTVSGLCRSLRRNDELRALGIKLMAADITALESLPTLRHAYDWVVYCASASGGTSQDYERVYLQGTGHVISWLSAACPSKFVYTSSTSVYGQLDGVLVDETSTAAPESATGQVLVSTERLLQRVASETGFPAVVLRVAGIYGPGRAYWLQQVRAGIARIEGKGERVLNMIHCEDVAGAIRAALSQGQAGRLYNAVDDEPVPQGVLLSWIATQLGLPRPAHAESGPDPFRKRGLSNKWVSNRRLKEELGYRLRFPTFREGYAALLNG